MDKTSALHQVGRSDWKRDLMKAAVRGMRVESPAWDGLLTGRFCLEDDRKEGISKAKLIDFGAFKSDVSRMDEKAFVQSIIRTAFGRCSCAEQ